MPPDRLRIDDAEQIRRLKARYCRLLDHQDWVAWRTLFTDDCVLEWAADGGVEPVTGADEVVRFLRAEITGRRTCHLCANPEIDFTGEDEALATWGAHFAQADGGRRGYGYYHDEYRRIDGVWLIHRFRYEPLWVEAGDRIDRNAAREPSEGQAVGTDFEGILG